MMETILFLVNHALTLLFGISLSFAFCNIISTKKTTFVLLGFFLVSGGMLAASYFLWGEETVWRLYPLLTHLPLMLLLCIGYRKRIITVLASISLAYLCCQPAKCVGMLVEIFAPIEVVYAVRCLVLIICGFLMLYYFSMSIAEIFGKTSRDVFIFASIPLLYYVFDYVISAYTNLWPSQNRLLIEFLAFFLCAAYITFCLVYYNEYEKKSDAERREHIIDIALQQQAKELEAIKKREFETRLLRHDMRLLLNNLAISVEQNDAESSMKLITGYLSLVDTVTEERYCENNILNYILTNFSAKCKEEGVKFEVRVEIGDFSVDEVMFSSIVSNALDNALNAQTSLPEEQRLIRLMLKDYDGKLLLSIKNPFSNPPVFINGLPISSEKEREHGYGTQSIRYLTERLGGKCQFSIDKNMFVLRVVL